MRYTAFDDLTDAEYERAVFRLTDEQRAQVDSVSSRDAKTMYLQNFCQQHMWDNRPIVGVRGSLDPAVFTREWDAHSDGHMAEAWAEYAAASESTVPAVSP